MHKVLLLQHQLLGIHFWLKLEYLRASKESDTYIKLLISNVHMSYDHYVI